MKVTFTKPGLRNEVVGASAVLKNHTNASLKAIYLKKDIHPAIRREYKRIYDAEKREKDKPENQGIEVKYDKMSRTLIVNGQVIDRFRPNFFGRQ